jgi:hypothetical protein
MVAGPGQGEKLFGRPRNATDASGGESEGPRNSTARKPPAAMATTAADATAQRLRSNPGKPIRQS